MMGSRIWDRIGEASSIIGVICAGGFIVSGLIGAEEIAQSCVMASGAFCTVTLVSVAVSGELAACMEHDCDGVEEDWPEEYDWDECFIYDEYTDPEEWDSSISG